MPDSSFTWTGEVRPICQVGLSDERQPEPDTWLDVSCYVHEAELFRGRDRFTDRFQPGTATVTFKNTDGWADLVGAPLVVAGQTMRPGRPIRVGVEGHWGGALTASVRWLWRGWIDQTTPQYHPVEHDVVVVNCVDALGEAGSAPAPASFFQGVNEGAGTRVGRVLDAVEWFPTKRKIDVSFTAVQGTSLGALGIDLMGQAADSAGGVVHGDVDGDVVFRGLNWMLYDPDTPPDGIIGNVDPGFPGIPGGPGYVDPVPGYVYFPDPPPITGPTTVKVCADDSGGEGTLIEQGDSYEIFVQNGRLMFRSGGRIWDMGAYDGGCTAVSFDPDDLDAGPSRFDDHDGDDIFDPFPFPAEEVLPVDLPPLVELLAYRDSGMSDPPQASTTPGPITPGVDCWLIVLLTTIGSDTNTGLMAPLLTGGGAAWTPVEWADAGNGASSFSWVTQIGRVDPGLFSLSISWGGTTAAYTVTVWRCWLVSEDYRAHVDAATILRAATVSDPDIPEEVEPGDGPHTVSLVDGTGTVGTTAVDHCIIAQSLAEEATPPFGATFAEETPPWTIPALPGLPAPVLFLPGEWVDDFERADGDIGENWAIAQNVASGGFNPTNLPFTISAGAAVATVDPASSTLRTTQMRWIEEQDPDQKIEVELEIVRGNNAAVTLFTNSNDTDAECMALEVSWFDASTLPTYEPSEDDTLHFEFRRYAAGGSSTLLASIDMSGYPEEPTRIRLESDQDGTQRAYANDELVFSVVDDTPVTGVYVGMGVYILVFTGTPYVSPRILRAAGSALNVLKASWVAGWRTGVATDEVAWSDVNLGPSNIMSTQAAVVVETLAPGPFIESTGPLVIGGETNPYNRYIYSAEAIPGLDPNAAVDPIWIFNPGAV